MTNKFTGFKAFLFEYRFSNRARTLYHRLNINPRDIKNLGAFPVAPNVLKFGGHNKAPWDKGNDTVKWYEILELGDNFARVRDVTGKCDGEGGNTENPMAQCSATSGQVFTITGKELDWLTTHVAGQAAGGGMGGGLGGPPPMGGGVPPPPPPGGMGGI